MINFTLLLLLASQGGLYQFTIFKSTLMRENSSSCRSDVLQDQPYLIKVGQETMNLSCQFPREEYQQYKDYWERRISKNSKEEEILMGFARSSENSLDLTYRLCWRAIWNYYHILNGAQLRETVGNYFSNLNPFKYKSQSCYPEEWSSRRQRRESGLVWHGIDFMSQNEILDLLSQYELYIQLRKYGFINNSTVVLELGNNLQVEYLSKALEKEFPSINIFGAKHKLTIRQAFDVDFQVLRRGSIRRQVFEQFHEKRKDLEYYLLKTYCCFEEFHRCSKDIALRSIWYMVHRSFNKIKRTCVTERQFCLQQISIVINSQLSQTSEKMSIEDEVQEKLKKLCEFPAQNIEELKNLFRFLFNFSSCAEMSVHEEDLTQKDQIIEKKVKIKQPSDKLKLPIKHKYHEKPWNYYLKKKLTIQEFETKANYKKAEKQQEKRVERERVIRTTDKIGNLPPRERIRMRNLWKDKKEDEDLHTFKVEKERQPFPKTSDNKPKRTYSQP